MIKNKNNKFINCFIILVFFVFILIFLKTIYIACFENVEGTNIQKFANNRSVVSKEIKSQRGTIYDVNGEKLANNVFSYTLIAYLDPSRSENEKKLYHVKDKELTAKKLATVLDMEEEKIYNVLNQEGLYQVEFGYAGKSLTEIEKEKIVELELPGIDFIANEKRYYPNGDFLSYTLGYAKKDSEDTIVGEFGIESLLNDVLSGKNGNITYQKDINGYQIPGTTPVIVPAEDGNDIYLTIDSNVQFFIEQALNEASQKYNFEWLTLIAANAKTGEILGLAQSPSYDPNILEVEDWENHTVQAYEPGSIMKTYTYMAAMEEGVYDEEETFTSGVFETSDKTKIYDWNKTGFGEITFDQGYMASSNVGIINLIERHLDKDILKDYFEKIGFGEKTGITIANEESGKINFRYQTEVLNAGFGQGITTNPMQHIQGLTSIANDGNLLKPYIISKVIDPDGKTVYTGETEIIDKVASKETTDKMKELMWGVVNSDYQNATGKIYKLDGYDLIGKTGTAQTFDFTRGKYYDSTYYAIKSFNGMWPKDDPEIIIYSSVYKSGSGAMPISVAVKSAVKNISKYYNVFSDSTQNIINNYKVENYLNKNTEDVKSILKENNTNYIVLGEGEKIIDQYPSKNNYINTNDFVILKTTSTNYIMPNLKGYSMKQASAVCDMLNLKCTFNNYGYVNNQSKTAGTIIKENEEITIELINAY